jgi:DNA-binding MarR family transcriptional regulator
LSGELLENLGFSVNLGTSTSARARIQCAVLDALSDYRAAETAMLRRTRSARGHGETDALALRYLEDASRSGEGLRPTELALRMNLSSATVTAVIDRLVRDGLVSREPHPSDRRSSLLRSAKGSVPGKLSASDAEHTPVTDVLDSMSPEQLITVQDFLARMRIAVDRLGRD